MRWERLGTAVVVAVVPARIALDAGWRWTVGPVSVPQFGQALIAAVLVAAVALRWRSALHHPWRAPLTLWAAAVGIGALRAVTPFDAARYGLHLVSPALWLLALHAWPVPRAEVPRAWIAAAGLAATASLGYLVAGQPADHVLHGWPRLVGGYGNLHGHAAAMAAFAAALWPMVAVAAWSSTAPAPSRTERLRLALAATVAAAATACVAATWVRAAWLWIGLALLAA
ncbi:MAG: hypothetical protein ABMB14_26960, partial [Myxococcota bacterium]